MAIEVVTREDLQAFRLQLLSDIKQLIGNTAARPQQAWLRNNEVRKLLKVSSNTVQRLRVSGKLKSSKVGGVHYYRYEDIENLLQSGL